MGLCDCPEARISFSYKNAVHRLITLTRPSYISAHHIFYGRVSMA